MNYFQREVWITLIYFFRSHCFAFSTDSRITSYLPIIAFQQDWDYFPHYCLYFIDLFIILFINNFIIKEKSAQLFSQMNSIAYHPLLKVKNCFQVLIMKICLKLILALINLMYLKFFFFLEFITLFLPLHFPDLNSQLPFILFLLIYLLQIVFLSNYFHQI